MNPWTENLATFQRVADQIFNETMGLVPERRNGKKEFFHPPCDVEETDSHYLFTLDLPGLSKSEIKVELIENQLTISGERKTEGMDRGMSHHLTERYYGAFHRVFTLPTATDSEKIEASYENGILRVATPKAQTARNRTVKIGEGIPRVFNGMRSAQEDMLTSEGELPSPTKKSDHVN